MTTEHFDISKTISSFAAEAMDQLADLPAPSVRDWSIPFSAMDGERAAALADEMKSAFETGGGFIYAFELIDADADAVRSTYWTMRASSTRKCAALNKVDATRGSTYLYVGKSLVTPKRISQHIARDHIATYSMDMESWARGLMGGILLRVAHYRPAAPDLILLLEGRLSDRLRPLIGQKTRR